MTRRTAPPFHADQVGSLLRTPAIKDARAKREKGAISAAELKEIEDREIETLIREQESVGLQAVTDGEFRRSWWHFDFFGMQDGHDVREAHAGIHFQCVQSLAQAPHIVGKLGFPKTHPMLDHFRFLKAHARSVPKMTIPSPSVLHFRLGSVDRSIYPDRAALFAALADTYADAVRAFYEAGCRYLQFDDTAWAYLCSKDEVEKARARGTDVGDLPRAYAQMINRALAAKPAGMTITTHICRGNFRSTWIASGGYEPVAEILFGGTDYDGYFLEYDSDRAGGFEPLRFVPQGAKQIVLGLITTQTRALENRDDIRRRIDEAAAFVDREQLCLSPQCGFASTEEGNLLSQDEQWAKLAMIVDVAGQLWG
jgi:5-methyltetrahydropteroyltriglutamate--homocysteine methyltransferase